MSYLRGALLLLTILAISMAQQTNHQELKFDKNLSSEQCLAEMREMFQPQRGMNLLHTYLYSGKGPNQLGNFDECNLDDYLEYVVIRASMNGFTIASLGICAPQACSENGNYDNIKDMLVESVQSFAPDAEVEGSVDVTNEINKESMDGGALFACFVFGFLFVLWILGLVVQFTKIGDNRNRADPSAETTKIEDRKSKLGLFFYSWSPVANLSKLFTVKEGGDQRLAVLNGVRVLSICYVVVGHGFSFVQFVPIANFTTMANMLQEDLFGIIPGGFYAVDAFFFLSGFLSCYILTTKMYPRQGKINVFLVYFHRYYRLIWVIIFMTIFAYFLLPYLGDGPIYKKTSIQILTQCRTNWWQNLLFINNWYPWKMEEQCIGWVWYLANDFQFYLMTPFVVYIYCKTRKLGYMVCYLLILICIIINGALTAAYDVSPANTSTESFDATQFMYGKTFARMGAYFVGSVFGFSYFELSGQEKYPELQASLANNLYNQLKESRLYSMACLLVGVGLTSLYVFTLGSYYGECGISEDGANCWSLTASVLYNATARPFFVFGMGLAIAPTFVGRLRVVRGFLASEFFAFTARLNYMVYMIHCIVMFWIMNDTRQAYYINWVNQWYFSIGCIVLSFIFAVPATLLFETPFMNIEKYVLFPQARKPVHEANENGKGPHYEPLADDKEMSFDDDKHRPKNNSLQNR